VPLATKCLESLKTPTDEGFVRGRLNGRVREFEGIEGSEQISYVDVMDVG